MKQYNQPSKKPDTVQPKAANQKPVEAILNDYKSNLQRKAVDDEELLQAKFGATQLKGKDEEELLQGKFDVTQLKGKDDEELIQGKFETAQLKSGEEEELVQKKENNTGLPDNLKSGVENLSGYSMDDVKVHYNSSQPDQLNAHAYAQGTNIHMAPGQEKHLPHEAWHVVQQKQGRVKPTMQMKGKVNVNDDAGLENEADVMGAKALQMHANGKSGNLLNPSIGNEVVQGQFKRGDRVIVTDEDHPDYGDKGTVERKSITDDRKWSVYIDTDGALIRFFPDQLEFESNDHVEEETDAIKEEVKEYDFYRIYGSKKGGDDWEKVELKKQEDGTLIDREGKTYRLLNKPFGKGLRFVSKISKKNALPPTEEFIRFLGTYGFSMNGSGTLENRIHEAVVKAQKSDNATLIEFFKVEQNADWYTAHIRQGGLNELILTSDSTKAVLRGGSLNPKFDKVGRKGDREYTFVELQRDTSYPTKDFVFKDVYNHEGGIFQNSHVNGRMYYIDEQKDKHKTVGPVSPMYHLAKEESLRYHFQNRTTMKSLVYDLIQLHKKYLATKSDILSVAAHKRGKQIYEMRGGDILNLSDPKDLAIFADIVQNHTNSVIQKLKNIHTSLQDITDGNSSPRPPLSPTNYPYVQSPEHK